MSLNQVLPSLVTHAARGPIQPAARGPIQPTARLAVLVFTIFYFAILKERFPSPPAAVCFKCCFPLRLASPFHFPLRLHWQTLLGDVEIRRENCLFSVNSPGNGLNDFWSLYNPPPPPITTRVSRMVVAGLGQSSLPVVHVFCLFRKCSSALVLTGWAGETIPNKKKWGVAALLKAQVYFIHATSCTGAI